MRTFLFLTILAFVSFCPPALAALAVGDPAPALITTQFDDKTFNLAAKKGRVVIVNFWAGWCPPCQAELPMLRSFYRHHRAQGLDIIVISLDHLRNRESVKMFMFENFLPAAMLAETQTNGFGEPSLLPLTYVIDAKGIIRAVEKEPVTIDSLSRIVLPLLRTDEESGTDKAL